MNEELEQNQDLNQTASNQDLTQIPNKPELSEKDLEQLENALEQPLEALVEALLYVTAEPVAVKRIAELAKHSEADVEMALEKLARSLIENQRGVELLRVNSKVHLRTKPVFAPLIREFFAVKPKKLSAAALETLAVIAYQQPIVKSEIEKVRGVDVSPTLKTLLERQLIAVLGYQQSVGQPALYATTEEFLRLFGISSLSELPNLKLTRELEAEPGEPEEQGESDSKIEVNGVN